MSGKWREVRGRKLPVASPTPRVSNPGWSCWPRTPGRGGPRLRRTCVESQVCQLAVAQTHISAVTYAPKGGKSDTCPKETPRREFNEIR